MLTETELKERLQALAGNKFQLSERDDLSELLPAMLRYIGTTDSILRDDLIYSAFATWIYRHKALSREQLQALLPVALDEQHIRYRLGEQDTDSVFTRSFSMLLLPLVLISHRAQALFSAAEIEEVKGQLLYYLDHERDRRGFVPGKGWAHSIAHTADALDDLAQCVELGKSDLEDILGAIRKTTCVDNGAYVHAEDERMVTPVIATLRRELLSDEEVRRWIEGFADLALTVNAGPQRHILRGNVKNFLQSLYFRLEWEGLLDGFAASIDQALRKINPFAPHQGD